MGMFLIMDRTKRDILYKDMYLIHIGDPKVIPKFLRAFAKRNNFSIKGEIDISYLEKVHEGIHKLRSKHERKRIRER